MTRTPMEPKHSNEQFFRHWMPPPHTHTVEATFTWVQRPSNGAYMGRIYTDGSRIDGSDSRTGRSGLAFVVLDEAGAIIARACGVPPEWIDDIPGTEAWALLQAATGAEPVCVVFCDCQPCVKAAHAGAG